jgi:hypothetical protein
MDDDLISLISSESDEPKEVITVENEDDIKMKMPDHEDIENNEEIEDDIEG